jgi:hypothetical protein
MAEAGSLAEFSRRFDAELSRLATQDVFATACTMRSNSVFLFRVMRGSHCHAFWPQATDGAARACDTDDANGRVCSTFCVT